MQVGEAACRGWPALTPRRCAQRGLVSRRVPGAARLLIVGPAASHGIGRKPFARFPRRKDGVAATRVRTVPGVPGMKGGMPSGRLPMSKVVWPNSKVTQRRDLAQHASRPDQHLILRPSTSTSAGLCGTPCRARSRGRGSWPACARPPGAHVDAVISSGRSESLFRPCGLVVTCRLTGFRSASARRLRRTLRSAPRQSTHALRKTRPRTARGVDDPPRRRSARREASASPTFAPTSRPSSPREGFEVEVALGASTSTKSAAKPPAPARGFAAQSRKPRRRGRTAQASEISRE